jgi:hypothetical protein
MCVRVEALCSPETSHSTEGHSQFKQDGLKVEKPAEEDCRASKKCGLF